MAAGKKKKSLASNPARGFATSSIASKTKVEKVAGDITPASSAVSANGASTPVENRPKIIDESGELLKDRELHELTPDELEARLELSDLQKLVETIGPVARKDAARHTTRMQAERRVLRTQSDFLHLTEWLPDELSQQITRLLDEETIQPTTTNRSNPSVSLSEDDHVLRLWKLFLVLTDLKVHVDRIYDVLEHLLLCSAQVEESSPQTLWGLSTALQWLAVHCDDPALSNFDAKTSPAQPLNDGAAEEDDMLAKEIAQSSVSRNKITRGPRNPSNTAATIATEPTDDIQVSDQDSDMDPDEMLSYYLTSKARLFERDPTLVGEPPNDRSRDQRRVATSGERKLLGRIHALESDILFDKDEADSQWRVRRTQQLIKRQERQRAGLPVEAPLSNGNIAQHLEKNAGATSVSEAADAIGRELLAEDTHTDDSELLCGIFDLPADQESRSMIQNSMQVRNFGKLTGMSAKRILEDACKSRDSGVQLRSRLISETIYNSRHQISISWSKSQDIDASIGIAGFRIRSSSRTTIVEMTNIATPDVLQSEGCAATAALFLLFSQNPKDEKLALRLSPPLRDLWQELARARREVLDTKERDLVKKLRALIRKQRDADQEEDVVLTNGFKDRSKANSGVNTPSSETLRQGSVVEDSAMVELWQYKTSTASYRRMFELRKTLPMYHFRDIALSTVRDNQVTILCGETGCGKSTQMPAYILEDELSHGRGCSIYCTEPRRISAISLARRVSEELGEDRTAVGTNRSLVGYAIRLESQIAPSTRLVYATVGIVLRMLESEQGLTTVTHLIIDEVHERSIDTDFLLIVLRSLLVRRPDLRVILMSATVDAERFSRYLGNAPIITVPGRTFPVQTKFLEDALEITGYKPETNAAIADEPDDEIDEADRKPAGGQDQMLAGYHPKTLKVLSTFDEYRMDYGLIIRLLESVAYDESLQQFSKAILVFLPGLAEIRRVQDVLSGHPSFTHDWQIYPLHSNFSSDEQQQAFSIPPPGIRKIVLATNIAETGVTIPDVTCVIDSGKHKEMRFDERRQLSRLIQSFISKANAKQRRGRAGRVQQGICFHLFTKSRHDNIMSEQQTPEILRLSLQDLVMRVKICKLGNIEHVLTSALDPPSSKNIRRAIDALIEVNALTPGEELTPLGRQLAKLPLDAQLGKLILLGSVFGCLEFALTTAAISSSKSLFVTPMGAKRQADIVRLGFKRGDSDLLTAYNAYSAWRRVCTTTSHYEFQYCQKHFLSPQNLSNIEELKAQLLAALADAGFVTLSAEERSVLSRIRGGHAGGRTRTFVAVPPIANTADANDLLINSVTAWSFYPKLLARDGNGWRSISSNASISLHPTSINKLSVTSAFEQTRYLSFYSIMQSSARFTNAQETSPAAEVPLLLLAGDAVFNLYAGVIVVDGNRLRFKVRDWKTMIALQTLRKRALEILGNLLRNPAAGGPARLNDRQRMWWDILLGIFERVNANRTRSVTNR